MLKGISVVHTMFVTINTDHQRTPEKYKIKETLNLIAKMFTQRFNPNLTRH